MSSSRRFNGRTTGRWLPQSQTRSFVQAYEDRCDCQKSDVQNCNNDAQRENNHLEFSAIESMGDVQALCDIVYNDDPRRWKKQHHLGTCLQPHLLTQAGVFGYMHKEGEAGESSQSSMQPRCSEEDRSNLRHQNGELKTRSK